MVVCVENVVQAIIAGGQVRQYDRGAFALSRALADIKSVHIANIEDGCLT